MTSEKEKPENNQPPGKPNAWLSPRRKRFWAIVLILTYSLFGFFLAPVLVKNAATDFFSTSLGREATIQKVEINPYVLSLRVTGFELKDKDDRRVAAFSDFFGNFQLSSLFRRAWVFEELSLTAPDVYFERFTSEESRLSRLLDDLPVSEEPSSSEPGQLPRLLIHHLTIRQGTGEFVDNVPSLPVSLPLGPINIEIEALNTLPDHSGKHSVSISLPGDATLSWQGTLNLSPLESTGELKLENAEIDQAAAYLRDSYPLDAISGRVSAGLEYRLMMELNGRPEIKLNNAQAELNTLRVSGLEPGTEFLTIEKIAINKGELNFSSRQVRVGEITIDQPRLEAWLDADGQPSLKQLLPAVSNDPPMVDSGSETTPWSIAVSEFRIRDGNVAFSDRQFEPAAMVNLDELQLTVNELSNESGAEMPFKLTGALQEGGIFNADGGLFFLPELVIQANASASEIPLNLGQPYIGQSVLISLEGGALNTSIEAGFRQDSGLTVEGNVDITGLDVLDRRDDTPLVGWKQMQIDRFTFDGSKPSLHLSQVTLEEPFGKILIKSDRSTNLDGLMVKPEGTEKREKESMAFELIIGGTGFKNGILDFSDLSLPLPFATRISDLDGTISTISTASSEPANLQLEGQVDEFGMARINGTINLLDPISHTDTRVEFRNLKMSNLSPYSAQFAGQEIDEGTLELDLSYVIKEGQLAGENEVVLSQLTLGDKVESPDAVNLPLGLAIALLKDSNGVINLNLPVSGDINDPEFKIGGVILQAFSTLITKIVSAPFRLLGNLIGIDSEDLGQFQFLAGRADLTPPELEKVSQLQQALAERPELRIEITGVIDPAIDTQALKYLRLRETVLTRLDRENIEDEGESMMLDEEIRQVLEDLFVAQNPEVSLDSIKSQHMNSDADDPEAASELDSLAYAVDLKDRLLESEPVSADDLQALGSARAEAIKSAFLASGEFSPERIVVANTAEISSEDGEWVILELGIAAD